MAREMSVKDRKILYIRVIRVLDGKVKELRDNNKALAKQVIELENKKKSLYEEIMRLK